MVLKFNNMNLYKNIYHCVKCIPTLSPIILKSKAFLFINAILDLK